MAAGADLFRGTGRKPDLADISSSRTLCIYGRAISGLSGCAGARDGIAREFRLRADSPLKPGDTVLSINGTATPTWEQAFGALKQAVPGATLQAGSRRWRNAPNCRASHQG